MGMSDIALGVVAIVSFWRSLELQSAVMMWVSIELAGLVYGHFHQLQQQGKCRDTTRVNDHPCSTAAATLGFGLQGKTQR